jgi:two-component system, OmpR family, response regulator RstA
MTEAHSSPAPMRRVLLVEDSPTLSALIRDYLGGNELEVLGVMLPGEDGFHICRQIRSMSNVPILMYTARREDIDQVLGLKLGADDYVVKPLEPRVLLARVEALLRRTGSDQIGRNREGVFARGPIEVNRAARLVRFRGEQVQLTPTDFDFFWYLFSRCGDLVTRDDLERALRKIPYDGAGRTIDSRVFRLRKKFEQAGAPVNLILSIRSKGYLLAVEEVAA